MNKKLVFENGRTFLGTGFGADVETVQEVVFDTQVVGYQEIMSDPSYCKQLVCMTYPIIGRRAEIAVGAEADIAVFDLNEKFTVDPDQFVSKGKSSPFTGTELYGVTELTVCAGNIVYRRR